MQTDFTVIAMKPHIALNVSCIEKSVAFYQKLFGIRPTKVRADYAKFDVQNPPLNLALNEASPDARGSLSHLGIQVASTADVLATKARWEENGLSTRDEMQTNCCYALQNKTWASDPDGNEWEVFVVLEDDSAEISTCCVADSAESPKTAKSEISATDCCGPASAPVSINRFDKKSCC